MWKDGERPTGECCEKPKEAGSPYCAEHRRISRMGANGGFYRPSEPQAKPSGIRLQRGIGVGKVE